MRVDGNGLCNQVRSLPGLALLPLYNTKQVQGIGMAGRCFQDVQVSAARAVELATLVAGQRQL